MKKLLLFFGLLAMIIMPVFCQDVDVPTTVIEWVGLLPLYLGSIAGVAVSAIFWVAIFVGLFNEPSKQGKYMLTGAVILALVLLAFFLDFGYLHGAYWWWIIPNWVGLMVAVILGYAIPFIKTILDAIATKFNPWKPSVPVG